VFIIVETFIFINLFVAVIVNNLEQLQLQQVARLKRAKLSRQKQSLQVDGNTCAEERMSAFTIL
jgi:hypothetical protein